MIHFRVIISFSCSGHSLCSIPSVPSVVLFVLHIPLVPLVRPQVRTLLLLSSSLLFVSLPCFLRSTHSVCSICSLFPVRSPFSIWSFAGNAIVVVLFVAFCFQLFYSLCLFRSLCSFRCFLCSYSLSGLVVFFVPIPFPLFYSFPVFFSLRSLRSFRLHCCFVFFAHSAWYVRPLGPFVLFVPFVLLVLFVTIPSPLISFVPFVIFVPFVPLVPLVPFVHSQITVLLLYLASFLFVFCCYAHSFCPVWFVCSRSFHSSPCFSPIFRFRCNLVMLPPTLQVVALFHRVWSLSTNCSLSLSFKFFISYLYQNEIFHNINFFS